MKVSVIVPVYNVEKYIERCVRSLLSQTLDGLEIIFVDDCSPDNSVDVINNVLNNFPPHYLRSINNVRIIRHKNNKGVSAARNSGLKAATGDYVIFCDSDDWVEPTMYEKLYQMAMNNRADIVGCDFICEYTNRNEIYTEIDGNEDKITLLSSYLAQSWNSVWNLLAKRTLYIDNHLNFDEGYGMAEDYALSIKLLYYAQSYAHCSEALYHYDRTNEESICHQSCLKGKNEKLNEDWIKLTIQVNDFFKLTNIYKDLEEALAWRILTAKATWLFNKDKRKEYRLLCPECNKYIDSNPLFGKVAKMSQKIIMKPYLCFLLPILEYFYNHGK